MSLPVVLAILLTAFPFTLQSQDVTETCDIEKFLWPPDTHFAYDSECLLTKIVDGGETALPILLKAMNDKSGESADYRQETSVFLISLIGGIKGVDVLRNEYNRDPNSNTERALCFAMASTGRKEDIEFLLKSLMAPDPEYDRWSAIEAAAVSLGILKYNEAIPLMKQLLHDDPSGLLGDSLRRSIDWLQHPIQGRDSSLKSSGSNQRFDQSILSCCPLMSESDIGNYSDTFISTDEKRALVKVMLHNQMYIYLLQNRSTWQVSGMTRFAIYD